MAKHGVNNLQVHKARLLGHFTPKLKWGDTCLAISGSHLKVPKACVKNEGVSFHSTGRKVKLTVILRPEKCFKLLHKFAKRQKIYRQKL